MNFDKNSVTIIISSYNPSNEIVEKIKHYTSFFNNIIIIDDGSSESSKLILDNVVNIGAILIRNNNNLGLAASLNKALIYASRISTKWVMLLDQDSFIKSRDILEMIEKYSDCDKYTRQRISMIVPIIEDVNLVNSKKKVYTRFPKTVITSGSLFKINEFIKKYSFEEKLFIDFLDIDLSHQIHLNQELILQVNTASLQHAIGNSVRKRFLFWSVIVTNHNYIRRYYITRNRIYMWKKYIFKAFFWSIKDMKSFFGETVKIILWENDKPLKIKMIFIGIYHSILKKYGKIPEKYIVDRKK